MDGCSLVPYGRIAVLYVPFPMAVNACGTAARSRYAPDRDVASVAVRFFIAAMTVANLMQS